jgi:replicative DNA helicase
VLFIFREEMYTVDGERPPESEGVAELIIGKQRNGPIGTVRLAFLKQYTRFENLASGFQA